jgi:predicted TIM-barrel fold metal-dependent hydrolase
MINVHKGFPSIGGQMSAEFVRSRDLPKVTKDWPRLNFVAYHSGYFPGEGIEEFLGVVRSMRGRDNLYAEIGSAFATAFLQGPMQAAHLIGSLTKELGSDHVLWGTDSIWWGSPQFQIEAFKALTIPVSMQEEFGYPPLTDRDKARILGLNAARLYRVNVNETRRAIDGDKLAALRAELGGIEKSRTHYVYGPRTRRQFLNLLDKT